MKKYYLSVLLLTLSFSFVSAQVVDTDTSEDVSSCTIITTNLSYKNRKNNNKEDVMNLQDFLNDKGYLNSDSITGFFGRVTEKAVAKFQKDNGLVANPAGFVGVGTRGKIKGVSCGTQANTNTSVQQGKSATILSPTISSDGYYINKTRIRDGDTYEVKWVSKNVENISILLKTTTGEVLVNSGLLKASLGSYSIRMPSMVINSKGEALKYVIVLTDGENKILAKSSQFTIGCSNCAGPVTETDQVTLISPNGGEVFKAGDTVSVKWKGFSNKKFLEIALRVEDCGKGEEGGCGGERFYESYSKENSNGGTDLKIPLNAPSSKRYKITIADSIGMLGGTIDTSDNFFEIIGNNDQTKNDSSIDTVINTWMNSNGFLKGKKFTGIGDQETRSLANKSTFNSAYFGKTIPYAVMNESAVGNVAGGAWKVIVQPERTNKTNDFVYEFNRVQGYNPWNIGSDITMNVPQISHELVADDQLLVTFRISSDVNFSNSSNTCIKYGDYKATFTLDKVKHMYTSSSKKDTLIEAACLAQNRG